MVAERCIGVAINWQTAMTPPLPKKHQHQQKAQRKQQTTPGEKRKKKKGIVTSKMRISWQGAGFLTASDLGNSVTCM